MLRRLVDHYWRSGDAEELLEMIEELLRQDALLSVETNAQTLGRALVVVSVRGNERLAVRIAAFLGAEAVDRFAAALVEEVGRGAGVSPEVLSQAARRTCDAAPELAFAELVGAIECAGSGDEAAARLLAALRQLE
jgi:sorbitol-specific phosphotransferase system component IIBC